MSDRKTTEIKLRLSPGEKTLWQLAAEQREVGLSQFIRDCVSESLRGSPSPQRLSTWDYVVTCGMPHVVDYLQAQTSAARDDEDSSVEQAVPTSGGVDLVTSPRKSWMFEGTNGD